MYELKDYLNSINHVKKNLMDSEDEFWEKKYPAYIINKCLYLNNYRMNKIDSFKVYPRSKHRYKLGKEILLDTLMLSKCNGLSYIKSNVISAAITLSKKKMKIHEIFLGYNSRNKFISKWLWFLKYMLPSNFGGLKIIDKKSYLS